jgi:uncharacterized Zn-finger protein
MSEKPTVITEQHYVVTPEDLPLHCPLPGTSLWNYHPRVYLPIEESGTVYTLKRQAQSSRRS